MATKKIVEKKTGEKYTSKKAKAKHEKTESKAEMKKEYGKPKPPLKMSGAMKTAVETAKARKTDVGGGGTKGLIGKAVEAAKAKKTATTPAPKMKKC
jgi:hypothetical protein